MDPNLTLEARRLFVSTALSVHATRCLRGRIPPTDGGATDLLALARRLGEEAPSIEERHNLRFDPPYPGVTAGVETAGDSLRLVLACAVFDASDDRTPLGTIFTTLIPGRSPQASAAPAEARIPEEWRPPDDKP